MNVHTTDDARRDTATTASRSGRVTSWIRRHTIASSALAVLLVGGAILAACSSGESSNAEEGGVLFSLETPYSYIDPAGDDFTITMPRDERVTWFASRPEHTGGTMPLEEFIGRWQTMGFDTDPPNAAIVVREDDVMRTHVVEVTGATLTPAEAIFSISEADETDHSGRTATHPLTTGGRDYTELFIDSVHCATSCASSGGTYTPHTTVAFEPTTSTTTTTEAPKGASVVSSTPIAGAAGEPVSINGTGFNKVDEVYFNGRPVDEFTVVSDTEITTAVPDGATSGSITMLSSKGRSVTAASFSVTSPAITSFSPAFGAAGSNVTVHGANLLGATAVRIGGVEVAFSPISSTQLSVTVGARALTGSISVSVGDVKTTSTDTFSVTSPVVTDFFPASGAGGITVMVDGTNFSNVTGVTMGGVTAKYTVKSTNSIAVTVPSGVATGAISVTTKSGTATSEGNFSAGPRIDSISPSSGVAGSTVTITGASFTSVSAVDFTGSTDPTGSFTVVNPTTITAIVPADATTGAITVKGVSNATSSTYTVKPVISDLLPSSAAPSSTVTIAGSGLTSLKTLKLGTTSVTPTAISSTQASFVVPSNMASNSYSVTITTAAGSATSPTNLTVAVRSGTPAPTGGPTSSPGTGAPSITTSPANGTILQLAVNTTFTVGSGTTVGSTYTGTGALHIGRFSANGTITITSAHDWTFTPTGTGSTTINGRTITVTGLTGAITTTSGTTAWTLAGQLSGRTALVDSKVTMVGADVAIVPDCPQLVSSHFCGTGPYLRLDGTATPSKGLEVKIGSGLPDQSSTPFRAAINLDSNKFDLAATFPAASAANWGGSNVTMSDIELHIAHDDAGWATMEGPVTIHSGESNNGFDVRLEGIGRVSIPKVHSWKISRLVAVYINGGVVVSGSVDAPAKTGPTFVTDFAFFQVQPSVQAEILGTTTYIDANTYLLSGSADMPKFLKESLGLPSATIGAYITYTTGGLGHLTGVIPAGFRLPTVPHISMTYDALILRATVNWELPESEYAFSIASEGTASIDGQAPFGVELEGTVEFHSTGAQISIAISAFGEDGRALWPNMFGVSGFDLNAFALEIGMTEVFPYLEIGIAGDGSLPGALREFMGIDSHRPVPVKFVADMAETSPCLQVSVGDPGSSTPFMSLPPGVGALTASYASMQVSTSGCSVGIFEVPAGVRIKFDGSMFGVKVDVFASYIPEPSGPPGLKTPTFLAWGKFDGNHPGPGIDVDAEIHIAGGGWNLLPHFQLRGGVKIDRNNRISLYGDCRITMGGPDCNAGGEGSLDLGALDLDVTMKAEHFLNTNAKYSASGELKFLGMDIEVEGTFSPGLIKGGSIGLPSWSFTGSVGFPNDSLIDEISVEFGQKNGLPFGSGYLHGNLGGTFKDLTGKSGRFKVGGAFDVTLPDYHGETDLKVDLGFISFDVIFAIDVCGHGSCAGRVTPTVKIKDYKGFDFKDSPIPMDPKDWSFSATVKDDWSESGQTGDSWAGLKGTVSADVYLKVDTHGKGTFQLSASGSAKAYIGVGGKWESLGTYGVSIDLDKPQFCLDTHGYKICV